MGAIKDRIANNLLLMFLIRECNKRGHIQNLLKLQKLVFLTQRKSVNRRVKGFSYNFFRWKIGPFSADLNRDVDLLTDLGLITGEYNIRLTPLGDRLLDECEEIFDENSYFATNVRRTAGDYTKYYPNELKERVYKMSVFVPRIRKSMLIKSVPMGQLILFKTSDRKAEAKFDIDEDWLATLEITFDREAIESLRRSHADAIEGKTHRAAQEL